MDYELLCRDLVSAVSIVDTPDEPKDQIMIKIDAKARNAFACSDRMTVEVSERVVELVAKTVF